MTELFGRRAPNVVGGYIPGLWDEIEAAYMEDAISLEALEQVEKAFNALQDYENRINWHTTCSNCASLMDTMYEETIRAETAEEYAENLQNELSRVHSEIKDAADRLADDELAAHLRAILDKTTEPLP